MIEELVSRVFTARNFAHLAHWKTKSYAQHMALDGFYNDVVGAVDELVECYQGQFGLIGTVSLKAPAKADILGLLQGDLDWLNENMDEVAQENDSLENLVQEIIAIYQKTIYKLKFLA